MRILFAEDEPVSRRLVEAALTRWGYDVVLARDGVEARRVLQADGAPRLAILDWMMPGMDGVQICRKIRQEAKEPYTYIILLTSKDTKEDLIAGLEAGADDYIAKPFNPHELEVRLRAGRRIIDLQAELIAAREAIREQATHDALTGLWNRAAILDVAERELARARREGRPLALSMLDLDRFKRVNDAHGHAAGDAVLQETANRIRASLRPYDSIGRYGGEEFLIVLPGGDSAAAVGQAERLRACIADRPMNAPGGVAIPVTASFGVVAVENAADADIESAIRAADSALYRAKNNGRNRVELAGPADLAGRVRTPATTGTDASTPASSHT